MKKRKLLTQKFLLSALIFSVGLLSCHDRGKNSEGSPDLTKENNRLPSNEIPFCYEGITELKRGDFIVKPNLNILPGSSHIPEGYLFGHAALVIKGAIHNNSDSLLAHVQIIESIARDVPRAFQVREIAGYTVKADPALNNTNFGPAFKNRRYRLRLNLTESQIDSIIRFALKQKNDFSNWNASKSYAVNQAANRQVQLGERENWADNSHWYCSLLIWQSVLYVTGIDLDPNGGFQVYPNDLINSHYFDNTPDGQQHRVKF